MKSTRYQATLSHNGQQWEGPMRLTQKEAVADAEAHLRLLSRQKRQPAVA